MSSDAPVGRSAVVVPAIDAPSSVACVRSLGPRGVHTIVVSDDENAAAFESRYCSEQVRVPSPGDDLLDYRDALLSLAMRPDVETIIPVREEDVYVLSRHRDEFEPHVSLPVPDAETLATVHDRLDLFAAAERAGVAVPDTESLDAVEDWDREWITKARYALLADAYVDDYTEERAREPPTTRYLNGDVPDVDEISREMDHVPIAQRFLPTTDEYGFFALYDRGEAVASFQHRQVRAYNYAGGPSAFRESVDIPALRESGEALLDELDWHGLAMVEFLRDEETGEFKLMEVNPRFWSSLPFSVRAGADFPYYYWLLARGERDRIDCDYDVGVAGHLVRGEISHVHSVLFDDVALVDRPALTETLSEIASSVYEHPRFDYLRADDPRPFVRDTLNMIEDLRS